MAKVVAEMLDHILDARVGDAAPRPIRSPMSRTVRSSARANRRKAAPERPAKPAPEKPVRRRNQIVDETPGHPVFRWPSLPKPRAPTTAELLTGGGIGLGLAYSGKRIADSFNLGDADVARQGGEDRLRELRLHALQEGRRVVEEAGLRRARQSQIDEQLGMIRQQMPDVYAKVAAGRPLPRGAVVIGGSGPRMDLLAQLAERTMQPPGAY